MKSGEAILGLLAGVAIGVTLGMLFAPDKGSAIRNKISKKGENLAGEANDMFKEFLNEFIKKYEKARESASALAGNGESNATSTVGRALKGEK